MNKVLRFLFPTPTIFITIFFFVVFLIGGTFKTALENSLVFFIMFMLPFDLFIVLINYFRGKTCKTSDEEQEATQEDEEQNYESCNDIEDYASSCVASCEFDKSQNNSTPGLDGNFRFNDKRFDSNYLQTRTKPDISDDFIKRISQIVIDTYKDFGVYININNVDVSNQYVIFQIVPNAGTHVKSILRLENEISTTLKTDVIINPIYQKGYIGLILPAEYFELHITN